MHANNTPTAEQVYALESYLALFNTLPDSLAGNRFRQLTIPDIRFSDPFNTVCGQDAVLRVLNHFAQTISDPHFDIRHTAWSGNTCLVRWDFSGRFSDDSVWSFPGVSEISLAPDNRIAEHIDHWDAATYFYQQLPVIGAVIRWIKRRINHH